MKYLKSSLPWRNIDELIIYVVVLQKIKGWEQVFKN